MNKLHPNHLTVGQLIMQLSVLDPSDLVFCGEQEAWVPAQPAVLLESYPGEGWVQLWFLDPSLDSENPVVKGEHFKEQPPTQN